MGACWNLSRYDSHNSCCQAGLVLGLWLRVWVKASGVSVALTAAPLRSGADTADEPVGAYPEAAAEGLPCWEGHPVVVGPSVTGCPAHGDWSTGSLHYGHELLKQHGVSLHLPPASNLQKGLPSSSPKIDHVDLGCARHPPTFTWISGNKF